MADRYFFGSFWSDANSFDGKFTDFLNKKYNDGWKYDECQFNTEGDKRSAFCVFEKIM